MKSDNFNPRSRMGSDDRAVEGTCLLSKFQSTLPAWRATIKFLRIFADSFISIHAPRMESDSTFGASSGGSYEFQSTLPAWRATSVCLNCGSYFDISIHAPRMESDGNDTVNICVILISIHAPRMESDPMPEMLLVLLKNFNPRSPHGERHGKVILNLPCKHFNPRSPHGERLPR